MKRCKRSRGGVDDGFATTASFSTRQVAAIVVAIALAAVLSPVGASAASALLNVVLTDANGTSTARIGADGRLQVGAAQSGAWSVGLAGGSKVGLDPAANAVQQAIPTGPFFGDESLLATEDAKAVGIPGGNALAVTAITLTNFDSATLAVSVHNAVVDGGACDATVTGGAEPFLRLQVPPHETLHLSFPTPVVFRPTSTTPDLTCIAIDPSEPHGFVSAAITGFRS